MSTGEGNFDLRYLPAIILNTKTSGRNTIEQIRLTEELVARKCIARSTSRAKNSLDSFADLVNKIYISNRLIKCVAENSSGLISTVLSFAYTASYVAVLIVTCVNRTFNYSSTTPIGLAVVGLVVTNMIVITAFRVQLSTNRLIQMMWTLIAATSSFTDTRVKHGRQSLIKQVLVMNSEGTMRVTASGLPVTYTSLF